MAGSVTGAKVVEVEPPGVLLAVELACEVVVACGFATVTVVPVTSSTGAPVNVEDSPMMIEPDRLLRSSSACWR